MLSLSIAQFFIIGDITVPLLIFFLWRELRYRILRVHYHPFFIVDSNINIRRHIIRTSDMKLGKIIKLGKRSYYFSKNEKHILISRGRLANMFIEGNPKPLNLKDLETDSAITDHELYSAIDEKITLELSRLKVTKTDMMLVTIIMINIAITGYLFFVFTQFQEQYAYDISLLKNITRTVAGLRP